MPHRYLQTLTTPAVDRAQEQHGSRAAMSRLVAGWDTAAVLGPEEQAFITEQDSATLATVGETGWPYVQHRGGPAGFLVVLGPDRIGWADLRGNRQYLSTGNLAAEPRASLLLLDHAHQRRLKIVGTVELLDPAQHPELAARLTVPGLEGRVEQLVVLTVVGHDWNCPQHITPRYTAAEMDPVLGPLRAELEHLRGEVGRLRARNAQLVAAQRR
jgi:predicted pyridoxine 5'-phosphate oxidase superfamily flavin-nucleotide-binding protein